MSKLYVPNDLNIENVSCVGLYSDDVVYITMNDGTHYELSYNSIISDYTLKPLVSSDVACYNVELTHDVFYRKDFVSILIIFALLTIIWIWFPYKFFSRCLGRWLKV